MPPQTEGFESGESSLSRNTQHALIALCSIGATILVFLLGWLFYHMRLSVCSKETCIFHRHDRYKSIKEVTPPLGRWSVAGSEWRRDRRTRSVTPDHTQHSFTAEAVLPAPAPVLTRQIPHSTSNTSRQLRAPMSSPTSSRRPAKEEDVHLQLDVAQRMSLTPSSPVLPIAQKPRSSHWSHSHSSSSRSSLPFYLRGVGNPPQLPLETSHFSWTDSQVTHTPTTSQTHRSTSTSRSSTPRFRTIDSWVGNQAARMNSTQPDERMPVVPAKYRKTDLTDVSLFQQHPGTEIHLPRVSLVPSEILNQATPKRRTGASF